MAPTLKKNRRQETKVKMEFGRKLTPVVLLERLEDDKKFHKILMTSLESANGNFMTSLESSIEGPERQRHQCFVCAQVFDLKEVLSLHLEKVHHIQITEESEKTEILKLGQSSVASYVDPVFNVYQNVDMELVEDEQSCQDREKLSDQKYLSRKDEKLNEERNLDSKQTENLNNGNLVLTTTDPVQVKEKNNKLNNGTSGNLALTTTDPVHVEKETEKPGNGISPEFIICCEICDNTYRSIRSLRMHQIETHTVCPMLECHFCSMLLDSLSNFNKHQNAQHGLPIP